MGLVLLLLCMLQSVQANVPAPVQNYRNLLFSRNVTAFSAAARALRLWQIGNNSNYPVYHFTAPEGWNNDPNGLKQDPKTGLYHRFYQYRPVDHSGKTLPFAWGHSVSSDLASWDDWPVAMFADTPWDSGGVLSGNIALDDDGSPVAIYTGNVAGHAKTYGVCARSTDWIDWTKEDCMDNSERPNPVSPVNWDTQVWKDQADGLWYLLIGGCTYPNPQGTAYLWSSSDLRNFTLIGDIWKGGPGSFWELPYLLPFDSSGDPATHANAERYALLFGHGNAYWTGNYSKVSRKFSPFEQDKVQNSDPGNYYSFNPSLTDSKDGKMRTIMYGWVTGGPHSTYWAGQAHSLARLVTLADDGVHILQSPAPEVELLRNPKRPVFTRQHFMVQAAVAGHVNATGNALEVRVVFEYSNSTATSFGLRVLKDDSNRSEHVTYSVSSQEISVGGLSGADKTSFAALTSAQGQPTTKEMRVFVDRSIVEVFVGGAAVTTRPMGKGEGLEVFAVGGDVKVMQLQVWQMGSMWE